MSIEVQFFGQLVDKTNQSSISLTNIETVFELKEKLFSSFPLLKNEKFVIAINNKMANEHSEIPEGATIALMPPFSGG